MLINNIPTKLEIKSGTFKGIYNKQAGSRTDHTLYCWFAEEAGPGMPHVSLHQTYAEEKWTHFHVTFPVLQVVSDSSGSWRDRSEKTQTVTSRYHVYLEIDDRDKVVIVDSDNTGRWRRVPEREQNVRMSFADMNRKAQQFGDWFYAAALFRSAGG